jgi:hypothetical protein
MLTEEEFKKRWKRCTTMQKKFVLRFIENGFIAKEAAQYAGYSGVSLITPVFRVQRKVDDVISYLIKKNNIMNTIVKPEWVLNEFKKLYERINK